MSFIVAKSNSDDGTQNILIATLIFIGTYIVFHLLPKTIRVIVSGKFNFMQLS